MARRKALAWAFTSHQVARGPNGTIDVRSDDWNQLSVLHAVSRVHHRATLNWSVRAWTVMIDVALTEVLGLSNSMHEARTTENGSSFWH